MIFKASQIITRKIFIKKIILSFIFLIISILMLDKSLFLSGSITAGIFFIIGFYFYGLSSNFFDKNLKTSFLKYSNFYNLYLIVFLSIIIILILYIYFGGIGNGFQFNTRGGIYSLFGFSNYYFYKWNNEYLLSDDINVFWNFRVISIFLQFWILNSLFINFINLFFESTKKVNLLLLNLFYIIIGIFFHIKNIHFLSSYYSLTTMMLYIGLGGVIYYFFDKLKIKIYDKINDNINFAFFSSFFIFFLFSLPVYYFSSLYFYGFFTLFIQIIFFILIILLIILFFEFIFKFRFYLISIPLFVIMITIIFISFSYKKDHQNISLNKIFLSFYSYSKTQNILSKKINEFTKNISLSSDNYVFLKNKNNDCFWLNNENPKTKLFWKNNCYKKDKTSNVGFHLIGDSHANHLIPMVDNTPLIKNLLVTTRSEIFFMKDLFKWNYLDEKNRNFRTLEMDKLYVETVLSLINEESKKYDKYNIILHSLYSFHLDKFVILDHKYKKINDIDERYHIFEKSFNKFILSLPKNVNLIIVSDIFEPKYSYEQCLIRVFASPNKNRFQICDYTPSEENYKQVKRINSIYSKFINKYKNVMFFDVNHYLCPNNKCSYFFNNNKSFLFYKGHFTIQTSLYLKNYFSSWLKNRSLD